MNSPTSIQMYPSGLFFDVFAPRAYLVRIEDIAHALTMQCRFSGHVRKRWSVAQHSLMVSDLCPPDLKLAGLMHDAAEAYLQDVPRPIKHHPGMKLYRETERAVEAAIAERFDIPLVMPPEVKAADDTILVAEACALKHGVEDWIAHMKDGQIKEIARPDPTLVQSIRNANPPTDEYIKEEFLRTFKALGGR